MRMRLIRCESMMAIHLAGTMTVACESNCNRWRWRRRGSQRLVKILIAIGSMISYIIHLHNNNMIIIVIIIIVINIVIIIA